MTTMQKLDLELAQAEAEFHALCRETRRICGIPEPKTLEELEVEFHELCRETERIAAMD